jgi:hypothetical protein
VTGLALLVGDERVDALIGPLDGALRSRGLRTRIVHPQHLSRLMLHADADSCCIGGEPVVGVVFRADPSLLVAPEYGEDDASFAAAEVRAVRAHVLSCSGVVALNRAYADTWFASSPSAFWHRALASRGIAMAPRRLGHLYPDGLWVRWTGGIEGARTPRLCHALGAVTVEPGPLTTVLCCAGRSVDSVHRHSSERVAALAAAMHDLGLTLAEAVLDREDRLVDLQVLPALSADAAAYVAPLLARWFDDAAANR